MSIELNVIHEMIGRFGVENFNLTVALAKAQQEKARLEEEVKRLNAELLSAQDKLHHFGAEPPGEG